MKREDEEGGGTGGVEVEVSRGWMARWRLLAKVEGHDEIGAQL